MIDHIGVAASDLLRSQQAVARTAPLVCGRIITPTITALSYSTPTVTISRWFATSPRNLAAVLPRRATALRPLIQS
jgi:hypothetical protein